MSYVDGFVIPVPKKNLARYRRIARAAGKVWREFGALEYFECVGDDLDVRKYNMLPFNKLAGLKRGEVVIFSWILYRSKAHRDRVNKKVMGDPRLEKMMADGGPGFDHRRMAWGGFKTIVEE